MSSTGAFGGVWVDSDHTFTVALQDATRAHFHATLTASEISMHDQT